jgi:DNA-nicking Smr family endonuclease
LGGEHGFVQHKTPVGLYRPPLHHRLLEQIKAVQGQVNFIEQTAEIDLHRLVDHQAQCTTLAVLTQVNHAFGKHIAL